MNDCPRQNPAYRPTLSFKATLIESGLPCGTGRHRPKIDNRAVTPVTDVEASRQSHRALRALARGDAGGRAAPACRGPIWNKGRDKSRRTCFRASCPALHPPAPGLPPRHGRAAGGIPAARLAVIGISFNPFSPELSLAITAIDRHGGISFNPFSPELSRIRVNFLKSRRFLMQRP